MNVNHQFKMVNRTKIRFPENDVLGLPDEAVVGVLHKCVEFYLLRKSYTKTGRTILARTERYSTTDPTGLPLIPQINKDNNEEKFG